MDTIYTTSLIGADINGDRDSCTGEQLAILLGRAKGLLDTFEWYAVDVIVIGRYVIQPCDINYGESSVSSDALPQQASLNSPLEPPTNSRFLPSSECQTPLKIGSTLDLIAFASTVPQFESGIFLGLERQALRPEWQASKFNTESFGIFEPAEIVIRAFDYSAYELTGKSKNIIMTLSNGILKPILNVGDTTA